MDIQILIDNISSLIVSVFAISVLIKAITEKHYVWGILSLFPPIAIIYCIKYYDKMQNYLLIPICLLFLSSLTQFYL